MQGDSESQICDIEEWATVDKAQRPKQGSGIGHIMYEGKGASLVEMIQKLCVKRRELRPIPISAWPCGYRL